MTAQIGVRQLREGLSRALRRVRAGETLEITDHGRPVARIVPPLRDSARPVSSHRRFRAGIRLKGQPLSATVVDEREDRE